MAKMGRPPKKINKKQFETLCGLQCTIPEFEFALDCSYDTINTWCKKTYKNDNGKAMTFSEVFDIKRGAGKISLRRNQFRLSEKNAAMAIFLGKQYLGQRDTEKDGGETSEKLAQWLAETLGCDKK